MTPPPGPRRGPPVSEKPNRGFGRRASGWGGGWGVGRPQGIVLEAPAWLWEPCPPPPPRD